ncbi:MAG: hypothetical protein BroJett013_35770 [Alphaproteobacteria bacterium]|nr:MAG: hypothetical protein BroJett013_35770 [Alphaproteobacteria bacterium]
MNPHRPRTTQKELQAFAACAFLCLLRLVGFLARWTDPCARRALKRYLQRKERFVATVLLLTAIVRIRHRPTLQPPCKPRKRGPSRCLMDRLWTAGVPPACAIVRIGRAQRAPTAGRRLPTKARRSPPPPAPPAAPAPAARARAAT